MHSDHGSECKARGAVCEGIFLEVFLLPWETRLFGDLPGKRDMRAELAAWQQAEMDFGFCCWKMESSANWDLVERLKQGIVLWSQRQWRRCGA